MGKKRARLDAIDVESERTLYSSFVAAANSMSQLYSQAVQQQRKASAGASRQTLERVLGFILKEFPNSEGIPKAALIQFLQQEYEAVDGSEHLPHSFPVHMLPTAAQTGLGEETQPESLQKPSLGRASMMSPSIKRPSTTAVPGIFTAMDTAEHERVHMDTGMQHPGSVPLQAEPHPAQKFGAPAGFGAC